MRERFPKVRRYSCKYQSGDGYEYDGGIWEMTETKTKFKFKQIAEPVYDTDTIWSELIYNKNRASKHSLNKFKDGRFIIYPNREGVPYFFTPL